MLHTITIRELNTLGNQLPATSKNKKAIQEAVLAAVEVGLPYLVFDDTDDCDAILLRGVAIAKAKEQSDNQRRRGIK